ncbi:hypothetical protein J4450_02255 [Candidatus Micrarchaeota archaeon]|nr:hypothetical protein [Candidatus Micrarchaeota archaeon]
MTTHSKRFLGAIVISDRRHIRASYILDGKNMGYREAKARARTRLRDMLEKRKSRYGVLYDLNAVAGDGKVTYESGETAQKSSIRNHERVHLKVEKILDSKRWRVVMPLEESVAEAIANFIEFNKGADRAEKGIRKGNRFGRHSLIFLQCIDNEETNGILHRSLDILYRSAKTDENRNVAWAFDTAANYMLYRECLAVLGRFGLRKGQEILFEALKIANKRNLQTAWQFLVSQLEKRASDQLIDEIRLDGKPVTIRSPYAPHCYYDDNILLAPS